MYQNLEAPFRLAVWLHCILCWLSAEFLVYTTISVSGAWFPSHVLHLIPASNTCDHFSKVSNYSLQLYTCPLALISVAAQNQSKTVGFMALLHWLKKSSIFRWKAEFMLPFLSFQKSFSGFFHWAFSTWQLMIGYGNRRFFSCFSYVFKFTVLYLKCTLTHLQRLFDKIIINGRTRTPPRAARSVEVLC